MIQHHTKTKGDKGVGFVVADLLSKGIQVAFPLSEHLPFDLIGIYPNGILKKISVKYREARDNKISISFRSSYADKNGSHVSPLDKKEVDLFAVYCPDTNKVYYFDHNKFNKSVSFDITQVKKRQRSHLADDYLSPIV